MWPLTNADAGLTQFYLKRELDIADSSEDIRTKRLAADEGFGVGHTRKTQTKGVWMWGEPLLVERGPGQKPLKVLLFDTEGFEATGKADAYDDRIFALSTILSAVLVYNLPETVRESDVQVKL